MKERQARYSLGEEIAHRREYSEATAQEVDEEIKAILDAAYNRAEETLRTHEDGLTAVAALLLEKEEIPGEEVLQILQNGAVENGRTTK